MNNKRIFFLILTVDVVVIIAVVVEFKFILRQNKILRRRGAPMHSSETASLAYRL